MFGQIRQDAHRALTRPGRPVERIRTAGRLANDPLKRESIAGLADMKSLAALAQADVVLPGGPYAVAAKRLILGWARTNRPTGSPIDETKLEPLFVAYDLTRRRFTEEEGKSVDVWLRRMAHLELQNVRTNATTAHNNWNSHRLKIVGMIGFLLADQDLINEAVRGFKTQIDLNLNGDGSSVDFHTRDALRYHCYDLEPLLTLAVAAQQNGIDLFDYRSPNGASLSKSIEFLVPYCTGARVHAEWVHSQVPFDRRRADRGETGFSPGSQFDPHRALRIFVLASFFDGRYLQLARHIAEHASTTYPNWEAVLVQVRKRS